MKEYKIPLRNKKKEIVDYALVDEEDFEKVNARKWHKNNHTGYAYNQKTSMHGFVKGTAPEKMVIDHKNRNKLDNRKGNLRYVTVEFNNHNVCKRAEYYGVSFCPGRNKYRGCFRDNHLGYFIDPKDAARAFDICAFLYYGDGASTNETVNYEEAIKFKLEDIFKKKKERKLPANIGFDKCTKRYIASITYNKKQFRKAGFENINDALKQLENFRPLKI